MLWDQNQLTLAKCKRIPRLYWNVHCTPGTEWLRLTPVEVPQGRVWTAKDDSRYLSPCVGLPGNGHD
jgi:hypothetical protein